MSICKETQLGTYPFALQDGSVQKGQLAKQFCLVFVVSQAQVWSQFTPSSLHRLVSPPHLLYATLSSVSQSGQSST